MSYKLEPAIWLRDTGTDNTWLITSELANQRARKVLFTCVVYTNKVYIKLMLSIY